MDVKKLKHGIDTEFVRNRISQLREQKGVSENQISAGIGRSRCYIQNIIGGRALPSMADFLKICDYLDVTPEEFFATKLRNPTKINEVFDEICSFDDESIQTLWGILKMLKHNKTAEKR